jgi:hypothetical protein
MPDGTQPRPGGWNRIKLEVENLAARVEELRATGASFRNEIVEGVGGGQSDRAVRTDDRRGEALTAKLAAGSNFRAPNSLSRQR